VLCRQGGGAQLTALARGARLHKAAQGIQRAWRGTGGAQVNVHFRSSGGRQVRHPWVDRLAAFRVDAGRIPRRSRRFLILAARLTAVATHAFFTSGRAGRV
jgi:hypothetical protein